MKKKRYFEVNWTAVQDHAAIALFGSTSDMQSIEGDSHRTKHNIKRTCTGTCSANADIRQY